MIGYLILLTGLALVVISPMIKVIEQLIKGVDYMADMESQALADLSTAVSNVGAQIAAGVAALQAALAGSVPPIDHSPAIEAAVASLNTAAATLKAAVPIVSASPAVAPSGPLTGAPTPAAPAPAAPAAS